jgi:hypothetical protein
MVAKVGMLFVLVVVVLMFGRSVNGHRRMIRSTKPKPPVKNILRRAVIAPTAPVNFKSISRGEQRPSIQVLKQRKNGRVLTMSYYEYKMRPPLWWYIPEHPMSCAYLLYKGTKYCTKVEELWRQEDSLSLRQLQLHLKW